MVFRKNQPAWNKGLKKGEHPSLNRMGFQQGELNPSKRIEVRKKISEANKGRKISNKIRKKLSLQIKKVWEDKDKRNNMLKNRTYPSPPSKGRKFEEIYGDNKSQSIKAKMSKASKEKWLNKEYKSKVSNSIKIAKNIQWEDEKFSKKMFKSFKLKKSNYEEKLERIIIKNNLKFRYTGDGKKVIGRFCPDFFYKDKIIELNGYWHDNIKSVNRDIKKVSYFKNKGFDLLIINIPELQNEQKIVNKIRGFTKW